MKHTKCWECYRTDGAHDSVCRSRGYNNIGPHPDAPPATAPTRVDPTPCACGIARLDCSYHAPPPPTERSYEVYDGLYTKPLGEIVINDLTFWAPYRLAFLMNNRFSLLFSVPVASEAERCLGRVFAVTTPLNVRIPEVPDVHPGWWWMQDTRSDGWVVYDVRGHK